MTRFLFSIKYQVSTLFLGWYNRKKILISNHQTLSKTESYISATKVKQKYIASKKAEFEEQTAKNDRWLERIQSEIKLETDPHAISQLEQCQSSMRLQLENMELKRNCQLYKRHVNTQEKDMQNTERWGCKPQ